MAKRRGRGREPLKPTTDRGRQVVKFFEERGLTLTGAAAKAGVSFPIIFNLIHRRDEPSFTTQTVVKLTERLGLPLELVSPSLAKAKASSLFHKH